jgi:transitional endoplasmic reticulum ATPase
MIGSTNHLELLDPGISKRPSRFDRKYLFPNPSFEERITYAEFWRDKLLKDDESSNPNSGGSGSNPDEKLEFPKEMCKAVAGITDGFSFAYIQEAFVAALLTIASEEDELFEFELALQGNGCAEHDKKNDDHNLDRLPLWRELKRQVKILREDLNSSSENMAIMV